MGSRGAYNYGDQLDLRGELRIPAARLVPAVDLLSSSGEMVSLEQTSRDSHLVLFFCPGDRGGLRYPQLAGRTAEICQFQDRVAELNERGTRVYGVSLQSTARQRELVEREKLSIDMLSDYQGALVGELALPVWESSEGERFVSRVTLVVRGGGEVSHVFEVQDPVDHVSCVVDRVKEL